MIANKSLDGIFTFVTKKTFVQVLRNIYNSYHDTLATNSLIDSFTRRIISLVLSVPADLYRSLDLGDKFYSYNQRDQHEAKSDEHEDEVETLQPRLRLVLLRQNSVQLK